MRETIAIVAVVAFMSCAKSTAVVISAIYKFTADIVGVASSVFENAATAVFVIAVAGTLCLWWFRYQYNVKQVYL